MSHALVGNALATYRSAGAHHCVALTIDVTLLTELKRRRCDMFIGVTVGAASSVRSGMHE